MKIHRLFYMCLLLKTATCSRNDLLPSLNGKAYPEIEKWIKRIISTLVLGVTENKSQKTVFLVNVHFDNIEIPIVFLNVSNKLPDLTPLDTIVPKHFFIFINSTDEIDNVMRNFESYSNFFNSGRFVIILPEQPTREIRDYFERKLINSIVFAAIRQNRGFDLYNSHGANVSQDFIERLLVTKVPSLKVCSDERAPYTYLPSKGKGIVHDIVDLAGTYLKTNITYWKPNLSVSCKQNGKYTGFWQAVYNHSCDAVIGLFPCPGDLLDFDIGRTGLDDAAILIVPQVDCSRRVGLIPMSGFTVALLTVSYVANKLIQFMLNRRYARNRVEILVIQKAKIVVLSTTLLSAIALNAFFQSKIYYSLVGSQEHCGITDIDELIDGKNDFGVEAMFGQNHTAISQEAIRNKVKSHVVQDNDIEHLNTSQSYVMRDILFKYLLPRRFITKDGKMVFRKVQVLSQFHNIIAFPKRHYAYRNLTIALLIVEQAGLNGRTFSALRGAKHGQFESPFTPIKFREIAWLLYLCLVLEVFCVLVFLAEVFGPDWIVMRVLQRQMIF